MAPLPGNRARAGFTLLETVAALALLGVGLSILYAGYLQAARLEARAAEAGTALVLARTKLAQIEAGEERDVQGTFPNTAGYRWSLTREAAGNGLTRLTVEVSWGGAAVRTVEVWTLSNAAN